MKNLEPNQLIIKYHVGVVIKNRVLLGKCLQTVIVDVEELLAKLQLLVNFSCLQPYKSV
jgi:hypothetical protein